MKDLNFLKPINLQVLKNNPKKLILVFSVSLVLLLVIFNLPTIWGNISFYLFNGQEKENEKLTEEYRKIYGYKGETQPQPLQTSSLGANMAYATQGTTSPKPVLPINFSGTLSVPKINITAPIVIPASSDTNSILKDLQKGVVLYPGSSMPGDSGTTMIIGHSSSNYPWQKYSSVFALLNKLEAGDSVFISYQGKELAYQVTAKKIGTVSDLSNANITDNLVLGSCWPVGTDKNRILILAKLVN